MREIITAGHLCLDFIPDLTGSGTSLEGLLSPGKLAQIGAAAIATGGSAANTGLALHRLGFPVRIVGKVGGDLVGRTTLEYLQSSAPALTEHMIVSESDGSSYTLVFSQPGQDRAFLHHPGANDTFSASDVPDAALDGASLLHFGYPPIMAAIMADGGEGLAALFRKARARGLVTSLDMCMPDPDSIAGHLDWSGWLQTVLPEVDFFLPSIEEILMMTDRQTYSRLASAGGDILAAIDPDLMAATARRLLDWGAAAVGLKVGEHGFYLKTHGAIASAIGRLGGDPALWTDRELLSPCFSVELAGATGSGDCTIAGFLAALTEGCDPEEALTHATAVGACNVEKPDSVSGVPPWISVRQRIAAGWSRHEPTMALTGWKRLASGVRERGFDDQ